MISTVSKNGAASSLRRISRTAEIEKLAATMACPLSGVAAADAKAARSASESPDVPTIAWIPWPSSTGTLLPRRGCGGEVDDHLTLCGGELVDTRRQR